MPGYKDEKWKSEKEHRWCMMDRGPSLKILPKFKSANSGLLNNFVLEQLREVVIGRDSSEDVASVKALLNSCGYNVRKINVTKK